ncbi:MAG TPA: hypothetical protein VGT79_03955 [Xanthomonadaceae bacterium]|nr:hypothetical protein [Xanthomonadaceae bacterium]
MPDPIPGGQRHNNASAASARAIALAARTKKGSPKAALCDRFPACRDYFVFDYVMFDYFWFDYF